MSDIRLSEHFMLREFLRSETASRMGSAVDWPPAYVQDNLARLCEVVLEPFRRAVGQPVTILSGYRPVWLNTAVGGSSRSDHLIGRAADFIVAGVTNEEACRRIVALGLPFRQLILEFPPHGWVHVSVNEPGAARRQVLTARKEGKRTVYYNGLHVVTL